jgi:hypothetical protein
MTVIFKKSLLYSDLNLIENKQFLFDGELRIDHTSSRLYIFDDVFLEIHMLNFLNDMLDNVPCCVGGEYLYTDKASIQGVFKFSGGMRCITDIVKVTIKRNGEEIYTF